jgi:hypothetical protein
LLSPSVTLQTVTTAHVAGTTMTATAVARRPHAAIVTTMSHVPLVLIATVVEGMTDVTRTTDVAEMIDVTMMIEVIETRTAPGVTERAAAGMIGMVAVTKMIDVTKMIEMPTATTSRGEHMIATAVLMMIVHVVKPMKQ